MIPADSSFKLLLQGLRTYHRYFQAILTFCAGVGLSAYAALVVYEWEQKAIQMQWQIQLDRIATALQRDLIRNVEFLEAVGSFYMASEIVETNEFETFTSTAIYRHPSIEAIAWLPRVFDAERSAFEQTKLLTEISNFGEIIKATNQPEYFPISHIVPLSKYQNLIGVNLQINSTFKSIFERALSQNQIIATNLNPLENSAQFENSFLVFLPIYYQGVSQNFLAEFPPLNSEPNPQNLRGFIFGAFQPQKSLETALESSELEPGINLSLEDLISPEKDLIAFYQASTQQTLNQKSINRFLEKGSPASCLDGSACTRILNVENRRWLLRLLLAPEYTNLHKHWRSWSTLLLGSAIAGVISTYLLILWRYTEKIEKAISERVTESKKLEKALQELQQTQSQLVQIEKMSSLGQLVAGVAHEINNPVNFIEANLHYAQQYTEELIELIKLYQKYNDDPPTEILEYHEAIDLDFLQQDFAKIIHSMKVGTERINKIVVSLKNFSHLDESGLKLVNVHEELETSVLLLEHRLHHALPCPIQVLKSYADLPLIECYPADLNQVFMNLLGNAIDALEARYTSRNNNSQVRPIPCISLHTEVLPSNFIKVRIADNGSGMNEEVQKKLFDPFFTTKPVGKGTGLGLAISYQIIVLKHGGILEFNSVCDEGTEFKIQLPITQKNTKFNHS